MRLHSFRVPRNGSTKVLAGDDSWQKEPTRTRCASVVGELDPVDTRLLHTVPASVTLKRASGKGLSWFNCFAKKLPVWMGHIAIKDLRQRVILGTYMPQGKHACF